MHIDFLEDYELRVSDCGLRTTGAVDLRSTWVAGYSEVAPRSAYILLVFVALGYKIGFHAFHFALSLRQVMAKLHFVTFLAVF